MDWHEGYNEKIIHSTFILAEVLQETRTSNSRFQEYGWILQRVGVGHHLS